jgi:hypothetical protein
MRDAIKTDSAIAKVWQAAEQRRAADIAVMWRGSRINKNFRAPADRRRSLAIPTAFTSLVLAAAVWTLLGTPTHHVKRLASAPCQAN